MDCGFTAEDEKYTDTHTLYLQVRGLQIHDVQLRLEKWMHDQAIEKLGTDDAWHVNYVMNARNEFLGFAYLWVSNPAVYHTLLGRNPDGSPRQRIIYNDIDADKAFLTETWEWPDDAKPAVVPDFSKEAANEAPPITIEVLPPLVDVSYIEDSNGNAVSINVMPAFVRASELCSSLVIRNMPPGLTKQHLLDLFKPYSSTNDYPIVNVTNSKDGRSRAFIYYHPHTRDACFAMLMRRKFPFETTTVLVDYDNSSVATDKHPPLPHSSHQNRRRAQPPPGCAPARRAAVTKKVN